MPKSKQAKDIPLVSFDELKTAVKKVLSNTKRESDEQLEAIHASNIKRRAVKKG